MNPITHLLALGTILIVAGFFAVMFAGMALFEKDVEESSEPTYEPGEIDDTNDPDDDSVIFPKY